MAKPSSEYINSMHANAKRRRLRTGTDAVVPDNDGGQSYSELVVIGYTERGIPLYEKKCLSNDNANPYSGDCTDDVAVEDVDVDGDGDGDGDGGDTTSYAYECVSNCNTHDPGNSYDLGWTFVGTCRMDADCPDAYDANDESYVTGDKVAVSSDYMNGKVIGSVSCPRGEESSDDLMKKNSTVLVPYAYEVETSKVSTADVFLPRLEEQILLNLADTLMSCLGGGQAQDGVRFDVRGIESSPDDVTVTEGENYFSDHTHPPRSWSDKRDDLLWYSFTKKNIDFLSKNLHTHRSVLHLQRRCRQLLHDQRGHNPHIGPRRRWRSRFRRIRHGRHRRGSDENRNVHGRGRPSVAQDARGHQGQIFGR